ncbi:MAG: hypothetical protein RLZZ350_353 [Verrucomicrobiota bacterium]|jgi:hypothetical protein
MNRHLRATTVWILAASFLAAVFYFKGSGPIGVAIVSFPLALFGGAIKLSKTNMTAGCTLTGLVAALAFGIYNYYQAFYVHLGGEMDALAMLMVPLVQSVIGIFVLAIAFLEWMAFRSEKQER